LLFNAVLKTVITIFTVEKQTAIFDKYSQAYADGVVIKGRRL